jgi:restriction endonuclease S subunit
LPEVLQTFFNSIVGQEIIYRYIVGSTGIISIKNDFILNLKIPLIKPEIQKQIADKIIESHKLRKESKELLETAKRAVEIAIEEDEDSAVSFITNNYKFSNILIE